MDPWKTSDYEVFVDSRINCHTKYNHELQGSIQQGTVLQQI
jgi:hypothetical protein